MNLLAAIGFTTPLMLLGMSAVALPVIAHLLNRRARRRLVFPTIRLLQEAAASQSNLFRLRRILLLALRCLAIILIAWAFARPVWLDSALLGGAPGSGAAAVVLVLDVSASSGQISGGGGVPVAHRMAAAADAVLDDLRSGRDVANIIYAGARPRASFEQLVGNLDVLRSELRDLSPTYERADLTGAIAVAAAMLDRHEGPRRIVVISDMQRSNWADALIQAARVGSDGLPIHMTIVPIGEGDEPNVALSRARVFPARPVLGRAATLAATVTNHSDRVQQVHVELAVDGSRTDSRDITLDARRQQDLSFEASFANAGPHAVVFSITSDALAADNRAYLAVDAVERVPVVMISDDDPSQPGGGGFYLLRALAPGGEAGDAVALRHLRSTQVDAAALQGVAAVFVTEVDRFSESAVAALSKYVQRGGGLVIFAGPATSGAAATLPDIPFVPIATGVGEPRFVTSGAWSAGPLRHFDLAAQDALSRIPILTRWEAGALAADALPLLRFDNGGVAMAERTVGEGRIILSLPSPSPAAGDLARHGVFVALVQGLVEHVQARRDPARAVTAGEPIAFQLDLPADTPLTLRGPDGQPLIAPRTADADELTLTLQAASRAGIYTVESPQGIAALRAVNIDERESDLRRLDRDTIYDIYSGFSDDSMTIAAGDRPMLNLEGRPLWPWFVLAALAAVALELSLLNLWKR